MHNHSDQDGCRHLLGDLSEYLDGEASAELCAEIEGHMAGCEDCRVVIDTLSKTIVLYRTMPQPELPAGVRQRLYKALDLEAYSG
ncbi:MAG: zf-HC2 domain-containing protein [Candidatus Promineifilaceae bacterium]